MSSIKHRVARLEAKRPDPDRPYIGCIPMEEGMTGAEYRVANERAMARMPMSEEEWIAEHRAEIRGRSAS